MTNLISSIKENEGFVDHVYKDHLGNDTIGYGFLVSALQDDELELNGGFTQPMSKEVANKILDLKLKKLKDSVFRLLPWLEAKPKNIQEAIIEMAYQLGTAKMMTFRNTLGYIKNSNYEQAIINLRASLWYRQTPKRVLNLISALEV